MRIPNPPSDFRTVDFWRKIKNRIKTSPCVAFGLGLSFAIFKDVPFELEIVTSLNGSEQSYVIPMPQKRFRVGRSLKNQILLLHPQVPLFAGVVERQGWNVFWLPHTGGEKVRLRKEWVKTGPYFLRVRWSSLLRFAVAFLGLSLCSSVFWMTFHSRPVLSSSAVRKTDVAPQRLPARGEFKRIKGLPRSESFQIQFQWTQNSLEPLELHITPGGISRDTQVQLEVNGTSMAFLDPCPSKSWGREERHFIPTRFLKNGTNQISIKDQGLLEGETRWGVRNVYLNQARRGTTYEDSPEQLFRSAQKMFGQRSFHPGELVRSRQTIQKSLALWRMRETKIPEEVIRLQKKIEEAEETMFEQLMSEARAALSLGKRSYAVHTYEQLLQELIEPTDPRRREVQAALYRIRSLK